MMSSKLKLSKTLCETNSNSYRAYELMTDNKNKEKINTYKVPCTYLNSRDTRFKWQTDKTCNTLKLIKGDLQNCSSNKKDNRKNWDGFLNLKDDIKSVVSLRKSFSQRIIENKILEKITQPRKNLIFPDNNEKNEKTMKKINFENNHNLHKSGSMVDLFSRTSDVKINTKYTNREFIGNGIFTTQKENRKSSIKMVDVESIRNNKNYAGINKKVAEFKYFNENKDKYSRLSTQIPKSIPKQESSLRMSKISTNVIFIFNFIGFRI